MRPGYNDRKYALQDLLISYLKNLSDTRCLLSTMAFEIH